MTITWDEHRPPWHLFREPVSLWGFWFIAAQRVLLATLLGFAVPFLFALGVSAIHARLSRWPRSSNRMPVLVEALVVCAIAIAYACFLAPRVETSLVGDPGAVI